jgi:hypothetical protein
MVFGRASLDDYVRRTGILRAASLPCIAHSLTADEARAVNRGHIVWGATVVIGFAVIFGGIALAAHAPPEKLRGLGYAIGGAALIAFVITWLKLRKKRDYRDPCIRIEIGPEEVVVAGPAGRDARPYDDLAIADLLSGSTKSSRYFLGIVLDTRLGPIRLEDEYYRPGKAAAGAILKRMDELGLPLSLRS